MTPDVVSHASRWCGTRFRTPRDEIHAPPPFRLDNKAAPRRGGREEEFVHDEGEGGRRVREKGGGALTAQEGILAKTVDVELQDKTPCGADDGGGGRHLLLSCVVGFTLTTRCVTYCEVGRIRILYLYGQTVLRKFASYLSQRRSVFLCALGLLLAACR